MLCWTRWTWHQSTPHPNGAGQPHTLTSTGTTGGTQTLTWDDAGRLTDITGGTAGDSHYVHDADGNVLLQKDPGTTTLYLPGEQLTLNTTTSTVTGNRYYTLPGGGTAVRTGNTSTGTSTHTFEIPDQHGTAGLALDSTAQTPTWRQFTPYGAPRGTTTWTDNRGFLNAPTDTTTGGTILGARHYDPATARFISLDPVLNKADPQSLGGYAYAGENPVNLMYSATTRN